jgi:hypothetical protein
MILPELAEPTELWATRSVLPGKQDGGPIVYKHTLGGRKSQLDTENLALNNRKSGPRGP